LETEVILRFRRSSIGLFVRSAWGCADETPAMPARMVSKAALRGAVELHVGPIFRD
jgi:hypothetical protein